MHNNNEALAKQEPQLETIIDKNGNDKTIARAADGKFSRKHSAAVKKSIKDVITFFEGKPIDPATGKPLDKTRHEAILDKIYEAMMSATGEDLVGLSKAYAELQKAAYGTKGKDRIIEKADPEGTEIRVILIPPLPVNHPAKEERPTTPLRPSFIQAEVVSTNPRKED